MKKSIKEIKQTVSRCARCNEHKDIRSFSIYKERVASWCKQCMREANRTVYKKKKAPTNYKEIRKSAEALGIANVDESRIKTNCVRCGKALVMTKKRYYCQGNYCYGCN